MKINANHIINTEYNNINIFDPEIIDQIEGIKKQPENFLEGEELIFNIQNQNNNMNLNTSLNMPKNNKSHSSSIKTNATFGEISQKGNEDFSFGSLNNFQNQNLNILEKNQELTKDSIEILSNFILKEKVVISNINIIYNDEQNFCKNNLCIKNIKNNLFSLENKLSAYLRKPFMRKNIKKKKNIIKNMYDGEEQEEDEKIKFDEDDIKMKDIKDDDSKTNNDSCEEINTGLEKRKFQSTEKERF